MAMKVKTIFDTAFKCSCSCDSRLYIGDFGDGQFGFTIKNDVGFYEVDIDSKDIKKIVKLLTKDGKTL